MSIGGPFPGYYAVPPKIIEFYFTFIKKRQTQFSAPVSRASRYSSSAIQ